MDFTKKTLGELLNHANKIIYRNAVSILKQLRKENEICEYSGEEKPCEVCHKDGNGNCTNI